MFICYLKQINMVWWIANAIAMAYLKLYSWYVNSDSKPQCSDYRRQNS